MNAALLLHGLADLQSLPDLEITTLTERADQAHGHAVFVCIRGARINGHDLAPIAYRNGCRIFVAEQTLPLPDDAFVVRVSDTRATLSCLACRFYKNPSHSMRLIGVTGTKGKTTVARLLFHILNRNGTPCGYIGTNGTAFGNVCRTNRNTTPDAITLQATLSEMLSHGVTTAVIEVSSQALMQFRADGTRFETVVFTNLSPDHISPTEHTSYEHYKSCKHRLFTDFGAAYAFLNADDDVSKELRINISAKAVTTYSVKDASADYLAADIRPFANKTALGIAFSICTSESRTPCSLPLAGTFNASNALAATAVANRVFGICLANCADALSDAHVAGRSEIIHLPSGACAVIDYAHNGTSLSQALLALRPYTASRLIVLFGSVGERSQMRRAALGHAAATYSDLAILTSDNPGNEDPNAIIQEIAQAFEGTKIPFVSIPDRAEAIRYAIGIAQKGDIILLAGKGHEEYQLIGNEKFPFSEREILNTYILQTAQP